MDLALRSDGVYQPLYLLAVNISIMHDDRVIYT
jgi:hypothetical protein